MLRFLVLNPSIALEKVLFLRRLYDFKFTHQVLVYYHYCSGVVPLAIIVWGRENCNQISICKKFVTIFNHLMRSANQIKIMFVIELFDNILPEGVGDAPLVFAPGSNIFVRVTPEEVAKQAVIWYVTWPIQIFDLF